MRSVTIDAFAKINLTLQVLGQRSDGFHEVRTVLQTIDLSDRIVCVAQPGPFDLRCKAAGVSEDRSNLVWRAADALWRANGRAGEPRDARIVVTKRIPPRAGLGGGSSDAAAALVALAHLWNLNMSHQALSHVAASLGADVPFFLWGGAVLGVGRGDEMYPLTDLPRWWVLIIMPPFGISTTDAYRWSDLFDRRSPAPVALADPRLSGTWLGRLPALHNDLEGAVASRHPEIARTVTALGQHGALLTAMSGSGSAMFGVFTSGPAANTAWRRLRLGRGWQARVVRLLPRSGFERRARPRIRRR